MTAIFGGFYAGLGLLALAFWSGAAVAGMAGWLYCSHVSRRTRQMVEDAELELFWCECGGVIDERVG